MDELLKNSTIENSNENIEFKKEDIEKYNDENLR
jgi:hypothetical protein